jgi:dihydrodipicolinate synthase/N-acetylneuraminate lyase
MKDKYSLRGVVVSLRTPVNAPRQIDFESYGGLVEHHLQEGAVGYVAPAQSGEVIELRADEQQME